MHAFMQHTNSGASIPTNSICNADSKRFHLRTHRCVVVFFLGFLMLWVVVGSLYLLASYLNKVGVSFLWVV